LLNRLFLACGFELRQTLLEFAAQPLPEGVACRDVCGRLIQHLQRRSQRPFRPPEGVSWYQHLPPWGLALLSGHAHA